MTTVMLWAFVVACAWQVGVAAAVAKPNIVLFLCDDMDYTLGAWTPMKQTTKIFAEKVRI